MTRTNAREISMHYLFALGFSQDTAQSLLEEQFTKEQFQQIAQDCYLYQDFPNKKQADYIRTLVQGGFDHGPELDDYIARYAKGWSFSRIPRVIACLMRVAMFEVLYMEDVPNSVAINDALEIAKRYDDPEVISFMNGILGCFVREVYDRTPTKPSSLEDIKEELFDLEERFSSEEVEEEEILSATKE